jgi:hypothetical protein
MTFTATKIVAGVISALVGFTLAIQPLMSQSEPPSTTIDVAPYLIEPPTTSTTATTVFYINPSATNCEQFSALAVNLGWPVEQRQKLELVMHRESRCTPNAHNKKDTVGQSYGLMQINSFWCKGPNSYLQKAGLITSCENLLHAQTNLKAGLIIWTRSGWSPWRTAK